MKPEFVHLHVHSDYSVLDGACKIYELLDKCKEFGMSACALTDHGNLFGAIEFYQAAKKKGIKPIIGCELYVAPAHRTDTNTKIYGSFNNHFLALCENVQGYHNLCKLSTAGYLEGHYYKPRVDDQLLFEHREGLIATTSCLAGRVPQAILNGDIDGAHAHLKKYLDIFGKDNFLVELMDHRMEEQRKVNEYLLQFADQYKLLVVATNDCHYLTREDSEPHDALLCIQTGTNLEETNRLKFANDQFYFKSQEEMLEIFSEHPEALANTVKIAERCNVEIPLHQSLIPEYKVPEGETKIGYLTKLVMQGVEERYESPMPDHIVARAKFELEVIDKMKFVDYFLVVWDLIAFARKNGIPVGPGRGSGAGSLVAYALTITNIDPIKYNLLFERFLNPDRVSMPDFDIDFCEIRRKEMIDYARKTYGEENVSQIITFGKMLAKNVIRNVGRVMGMSYGEVDRIAKLVPDELGIKLKDALEKEPELKRLIDEDAQVARLWRLASRLEGTIGNCGTHAAGVVICDHALTDHVALFKAPNSDTVATQAEMKKVEEVGLLKMDFLGLSTLTVVHEAVRLIRETRGISIDIDNIETNDANAYAVLRSGNTTGIFQLESSGMRDLAKRIGLESIEEVCALVALFRPGPMQFIDTYIENKFDPTKVQYDHPLLEKILKETYGIAVYQEQVMQMVQALGGFSLGQADIVRRAMGKKDMALLEQQKQKFIEGCAAQNISKALAETVWEKIYAFAGYGFNKSHSMAYAFVAYQTAYLKANYPVEFMSALLTSVMGNLDKTALYVDECRRLGIDVLPPDVNHSFTYFAVDGEAIRFGLGAIKNAGQSATDAIGAERTANGPFKDIFDFCSRMDTRQVNKRLMESLNKAGAFASTGWNRRQVAQVLDDALCEAQSAQRDKASGQFSLFEMDGMEDAMTTMHQKPNLPDFPEHELLQMEKDTLGLYITRHPLTSYAPLLERFSTVKVTELREKKEGEEVVFGGVITNAKTHLTKKGAKMAFLNVETLDGTCELTVFSDLYEQASGLLEADMIVMVAAKVNYRNDEPSLVANNVVPIDDAERHFARALHVRVNAWDVTQELLERVAEVVGARRGNCDVFLHCITPDMDEVVVHATAACRCTAERSVRVGVEQIVGADNAWFSAGKGLPTHQPPQEPSVEVPRWKRAAAAAAAAR